MKLFRLVLVLIFFGYFSLFSLTAYENNTLNSFNPSPWFTGSLLAPSGTVVKKGHTAIQPYFFVSCDTGRYDKNWKTQSLDPFWTIDALIYMFFGVTDRIDFQFITQVVYNVTKNQSSLNFGDMLAGFDFQLVDPRAGWFPGVKLAIREIFPSGKYEEFDQISLLGTEFSGFGSFITDLSLVFYKVFPIKNHHFLSTTFTLEYAIPFSTHVSGFNAFGGSEDTFGRVVPGNIFITTVSFEYSLSQNWVLALDSMYIHTNRDHFSGKRGMDPLGNPAIVGNASSEQIVFAPAIEYNFCSNFGIIGGLWFSALGRNSGVFRAGVLSAVFSY